MKSTTRRILDLVGRPEDAPHGPDLWALAILLLLPVTAQSAIEDAGFEVAYRVCTLLGCLAAVIHGRWIRPALAIAASVQVIRIFDSFPLTSNHLMLQFLALSALAGFEFGRVEERRVLIQTLRWGAAIVLFHTGLQKILYGTYFDGQFLGYQIASSDRFALLFQWFIPTEEFNRIRGLDTKAEGAGPFAVDSVFFLLVSNSVWIFELTAPFLMLWRRTRAWAAAAAMGFTLSIQAGAREIMFGLVFSTLLAVYLPFAFHRWVLVPLALVYAGLVGSHFGWLPEVEFN